MKIHGFLTLTLLDYPGHLGATVFLGNCNLRCPFCQNGNLVLTPDSEPCIPVEDVLAFLKKRSGLLEGVCISGGEPTLCPELPDFIARIKELGYLVKLDTNGSNPQMIQDPHTRTQIDYVAMDIKSSPEQYAAVSGLTPDLPQTTRLLENIFASANYLMTSGIDYEFRTTVVRELHTEEDFLRISQWLAGCKRYYLQVYRESENILASFKQPDLAFHAPSGEELKKYQKILQKTIPAVEIRGFDQA